MKIAGIQKNSFVDYPGKVSMVLFTPGCNMNCFYCHNQMLLSEKEHKCITSNDEVFQLLTDRKGFLDAVTVSGGEPSVQKDLDKFIKEIKSLGYAVKLDTNGTNPHVIEKLIVNKLVDYVAMDLKAPFAKYESICRTYVDTEKIKQSIDILINSGIDYEFRTTVAPGISTEDIYDMALGIAGARLYVLQKYRSINVGEEFKGSLNPESIVDAAKRLTGIVKRVETRGIAFCA
jgi:pyruvate formate lyase activating enzyme